MSMEIHPRYLSNVELAVRLTDTFPLIDAGPITAAQRLLIHECAARLYADLIGPAAPPGEGVAGPGPCPMGPAAPKECEIRYVLEDPESTTNKAVVDEQFIDGRWRRIPLVDSTSGQPYARRAK